MIDWSYQAGEPKAFPEWVPGELMPYEVESLTEQITELFRGPGKGITDLQDLFLDEEREARRVFRLAVAHGAMEIPL